VSAKIIQKAKVKIMYSRNVVDFSIELLIQLVNFKPENIFVAVSILEHINVSLI
jgi:hypothetical protein